MSRFPQIWAETGGSAIAGESSLEAVIRETKEELGIVVPPRNFEFVRRLIRKDNILDIWTTHFSLEIVKSFTPTPEVDEIGFFAFN